MCSYTFPPTTLLRKPRREPSTCTIDISAAECRHTGAMLPPPHHPCGPGHVSNLVSFWVSFPTGLLTRVGAKGREEGEQQIKEAVCMLSHVYAPCLPYRNPTPSVCSLTGPTTGSRKAEIAVDSDKIVCARMSYEQRLQRAMEASMVTGATASAAANPTLTKQVSLSSHCWQRLEVFLNEGVGRE